MLQKREQLLLQVSKLENIQKNLEKADSSKTPALNSFGLSQSFKRNENPPPKESTRLENKESERKDRKDDDRKEGRSNNNKQRGFHKGRDEMIVEAREQRRRADGNFYFLFFFFFFKFKIELFMIIVNT